MSIAPATLPIQATTWQLSIDSPNTVVTDMDALGQSVRILLTTEPGSDPARPDFGIGLLNLIGQDMRTVKAKLTRMGKPQFRDYLPDVEVVAYNVSGGTSAGDLTVEVVWKAKGNTVTTTVNV